MDVKLPKKCFISHSYADIKAREQLIANLPSEVDPQVFPPITVSPDQFVSNRLIESIIDCDALIYLKGGASANSFWVAFERDYALRIGKPVFSAEIETGEVIRHFGGPLDLATFASHSNHDLTRIRKIARFLKDERYFDLWMDDDILPGDKWKEAIIESLKDRLDRGGYVVVFWSDSANNSKFIQSEIQQAAEGIKDWNDRVLFALLEDVTVPDFWMKYHEPAVQLYGDKERSVTQRLDDLVVRLYWLIYRKTEYRNLENINEHVL